MRTDVQYRPSPGRLVKIVNHPTLTGLFGIVENASHRRVTVRLNVTGEVVSVQPIQALETSSETYV